VTVHLVHRHITLGAAKVFVGVEHRHHKPPTGGFFALGAFAGGKLVGVAVVGRVTGRWNGPAVGYRCEVTRLATDETGNACSFLYGKCKRVAQAMGYLSCKTYTRTDESGASLRAIGACCEKELKARSWEKSSKKRKRTDKSEPAARYRWELLPKAAA
jgi:hypothetical protein